MLDVIKLAKDLSASDITSDHISDDLEVTDLVASRVGSASLRVLIQTTRVAEEDPIVFLI